MTPEDFKREKMEQFSEFIIDASVLDKAKRSWLDTVLDEAIEFGVQKEKDSHHCKETVCYEYHGGNGSGGEAANKTA